MNGEPEYRRWTAYYKILADPDTPVKLKRSVLTLCPNEVILAVEELMLNINVSYAQSLSLFHLTCSIAESQTTHLTRADQSSA